MSAVPVEPLPTREQCIRALDALEDIQGYELASLEAVEGLERDTAALGDAELVWRAFLLRAELIGRHGDLAEASRRLWAVNAYALEHGHARLLARSHLVLSWTYRDIGDLAAYLDHAVWAVEKLDENAPAGMRALHLIRLADALDECGSREDARLRYEQAEQAAVRGGNVTRQIACLNNRAYGEYLAGDITGAAHTIDRLVAVSRRHGEPMRPHTLDTLARIQITRGEHAAAVATAQQAIAAYAKTHVTELMAPAEFLVTRAVAERSRGGYPAAQQSLDESRAIAEGAGLASLLAELDHEQALLFAAQGEFETAFHCFTRFYAAEKQLLSERRADQARLRQAVLETAEIRAAADRFRDEALRDPLTGLANRRYLDDTLPGWLARDDHRAVVVALVDLDHFKRVNDTCSHAAGDAVLVGVSALLRGAVGSWSAGDREGFVARIGGEEFVVVLVAPTADEGVREIERLRAQVGAHDWSSLTGELPVTLSGGIACAREGDTQHSLLRRADDLLYAAKRGGRNRVLEGRTGSLRSLATD